MATATAMNEPRGGARVSSDWLAQLLADVRRDVVAQPSPQAVVRIRQRLAAELKFPSQRAAA